MITWLCILAAAAVFFGIGVPLMWHENRRDDGPKAVSRRPRPWRQRTVYVPQIHHEWETVTVPASLRYRYGTPGDSGPAPFEKELQLPGAGMVAGESPARPQGEAHETPAPGPGVPGREEAAEPPRTAAPPAGDLDQYGLPPMSDALRAALADAERAQADAERRASPEYPWGDWTTGSFAAICEEVT